MKPLILQRADPQIYLHTDGYYYFTASEPNFELIELRRATTIEGLAAATPRVVWNHHASGAMSHYIWAPEIHYLNGKWYIYFAAASAFGATQNSPDSHRIFILENAAPNPLEGTFAEKGRMDTGWESFSLDSTTFTVGNDTYFVWAQSEPGIPGNSNLYIAKMADPCTLQLPAVRLSVPEFDWECQGYKVNEGPSVLAHGGKLYLTYSGSATDERYAMGMLTADAHSDLLKPEAWHKSPVPVMVSEPDNELYGPGHNSFTKNKQGEDILVFHARPYPGFHGSPLSDPNRHCHVRTVRYDAQDQPVFQAE